MNTNRSNKTEKHDKRKKPSLLYPILGLILAIILFCYAWQISNENRIIPRYVEPKSQSLNEFYKTKIIPLIDEASIRNKNAAKNALILLHDEMEIFRNGIDPFVNDITSWGARYGLLKRYSDDLWNKYWKDKKNVESVNKYVHEKFEKYLVSGIKLDRSIEKVIDQFVSDIKANKNILYSEVKLAIYDYKLAASAQQPNFDHFFDGVDAKTMAMAKKMSVDSVAVGITAFLSGIVAEEATRSLVTAILSRTTSSIASIGITEGSSTLVASSGIGGAIGTALGGPAGTIIGIGVGMVAGCIVDWWMTDKFKEKLAEQCSDYLTSLEMGIIYGSDDAQGLKLVFKEFNQIFDQAYRDSFIEALMEGT